MAAGVMYAQETPRLTVTAEYYPDPLDPYSPYVRAYWSGSGSYIVYRANCDGTNSTLLANNVTGGQYIDTDWMSLGPGDYKYGVKSTTGSQIFWSNCLSTGGGYYYDYYYITVSADPSNGGSVSGGGPYQVGQSCTVTATPNNGYTFTNWTENGQGVQGAGANYSFTVNNDRSLVAHFAETGPSGWADMVSIMVLMGDGNSPAGTTVSFLNHNSQEQQNYPMGPITIDETGYYMWDVFRRGNYQITISRSGYETIVDEVSIWEDFYSMSYTMSPNASYTITTTASPSNGGTVYGGGTYNAGATCTLHATANSGYEFLYWKKGNTQVSSNATYSFTVNANTAGTYTAYFQQTAPTQYTITASASPSNAGTITGTGSYPSGSTCTLHATPNNGYTFANWIENDTLISTNATYSFTVTRNRNLVAVFDIATTNYEILVSANPPEGGMVTGGGTYDYGDQCTVHATPNDGFVFSNWTEDGQQTSSLADYSFIVTGDRTLVANFTEENACIIYVEIDPEEGGTATGAGPYLTGDICTLTATAMPGYEFVKWTMGDEVVSTNTTYSFTVTETEHYVAHFEKMKYNITVTAEPEEGGDVSGGGFYYYNAIATLEAIAKPGFFFTKWVDSDNVNVSNEPSFTIQVKENASYTAIFTQNHLFTINVSSNPENGGSVSGGGTYQYGANCTLHATPANGYEFLYWKMNGAVVSHEQNYTFVVTSNATYTAYFRETSGATYTITTEVTPEGSGTVTGGGQYNAGSSVTLTTNANEGYTFVHWQDGDTDNPRTITVNGNATYTAFFQQSGPTQYNITVNANPSEGGTASGGGTFVSGESCTVQASPNEGFVFINWTEDDRQVSSSTFYTFDVTSNRTLVANFADENACIIFVEINPEGGGTTTGAGPYTPGQACTLRAFPKPGYNFINWTKDNTVVSENPNYTFEVTETSRYVAHFNRSGYVISASANPTEGGSVTGSGIYVQGMHLNLTATANEGYCFVNWSENGVIQCLTEQYEIVVERDRTLVANFEQLPVYTISATAEANGSIDPQGDVQVVKGSSITFNIKPDFGFRITSVTVDGNIIGREDSYTFNNVDRNHTIFVSFNGWDVEEYNATKVKVYPNPAKDRVFVEGDGLAFVSLCDLLGNCLRSMDGDISHEMNLSGLSEGVYVLMIKTKDGRIGYQKLVITK